MARRHFSHRLQSLDHHGTIHRMAETNASIRQTILQTQKLLGESYALIRVLDRRPTRLAAGGDIGADTRSRADARIAGTNILHQAALRGPGENYSVILRLVELETRRRP